MASLREIRRKIKSVKSTQQITKAMKMVAAARLRRAQTRILNARPFATKMEELMTDLLVTSQSTHPLMEVRSDGPRALLLVTSDKGLCGAFNTNLIREAMRYVRRYGLERVRLFIVGRKGRDYFRRLGAKPHREYLNLFNNLTFAQAEIISADLLELYSSGTISAIDVLYNEFKTVIQQKVVIASWLPLQAEESLSTKSRRTDFLYEPSQDRVLDALILRFLKAKVYRILLESNAAELGARMASMDNASRNASELMGSLTLQLNRTRQAAITKEILEVVSGAEALK